MAKKDLFKQICELDPDRHLGLDMSSTVAQMEKALDKYTKSKPADIKPVASEVVEPVEKEAVDEVVKEEAVKEEAVKTDPKIPIGRRARRRYLHMHPQ